MIDNESQKHLLTAEQLSRYLQIPLASVWRLSRKGSIPSLRAGRLLRFDLELVIEAMSHTRKAKVYRLERQAGA